MRTLIFGTSYSDSQEKRWVIQQWDRITRQLNPGTDTLIVDTEAPAFPHNVSIDEIYRFPDNPGHLSKTGQDGWGRAFCKGLEIATLRNYDYAVHIEADLLFARPVAPIIERMARFGVGAAAPMANPYQFIETALLFLDMRWVREADFIARYDWEHPPLGGPLPEQRVESILSDKFFALPLRGARNDLGTITPRNMGQMFPQSIDWLTHATPAVFRAMMGMNGLAEA
jgi:hypothetical protein